MYFVGNGALLERAIKFAIKKEIKIDFVILQSESVIIKKLFNLEIPYLVSNNVNLDLSNVLISKFQSDILLVNCSTIIDNKLLRTNNNFFNIHNGIVQKYRGIAEICVFAAICNGEKEYGATLQRLIPDALIDSGPIVDQRIFAISDSDTFFTVFLKSVENCLKLLEFNLERIITKQFHANSVPTYGKLYNYDSVVALYKSSNPYLRTKAITMGQSKFLLPRLDIKIQNCIELDINLKL